MLDNCWFCWCIITIHPTSARWLVITIRILTNCHELPWTVKNCYELTCTVINCRELTTYTVQQHDVNDTTTRNWPLNTPGAREAEGDIQQLTPTPENSTKWLGGQMNSTPIYNPSTGPWSSTKRKIMALIVINKLYFDMFTDKMSKNKIQRLTMKFYVVECSSRTSLAHWGD